MDLKKIKSVHFLTGELWRRMSLLPGGKLLFSKILGQFVPYTGSIKPLIDELKPGYARILVLDRRSVRNHLKSVHAIALANAGECATGLALLSGLGETDRAILVEINIQYLKKARGMLTAEAFCQLPEKRPSKSHKQLVEGAIKNATGEMVAKVTATWLVDFNHV